MTVVLFTAQWVDWSGCAVNETGCGEKRYTIYTDGTVENGIVRASLSPEAFARLKELFSGDFCHAITHRDAYDSDGWSMTLYAGNGHIIHETGLGYIYGVPVLEEIAAILRGFDCHGGRTNENPDPLSPDAILRDILQSMEAERKKKVRIDDDWPEFM